MEEYISSDEDYYYDYDYDDDDNNNDAEDVGLEELYESLQFTARDPSTQIIRKESLLAAQRVDLRRIMDLLSLKEQQARALLIHYRWDVDKALQVLVEKGKDILFAEAGVSILEDADALLSQMSSLVTCNICMEDVSANEVTTMDCGHYFCNDCWTEHFIVKINEGQSRRIRCMAYKCNAISDEAKVRYLVSARDPDMAERFGRCLLESYIEDNRRVKWCPSVPHCGNAIRVENNDLCEVECACGLQFCFGCSSEAHSPCSCLMWELWGKKCQDESATVNWMTIHTKSCPKCHRAVEKSGGCNLVTCVCGQHFCWLCGDPTGSEHTYTSISGHSCGRYREEQEKNAERAKRDLSRYLHYHDHYKAHTVSFHLESKLEEMIQERISKLKQRNSTFTDFSWVTNGLYRLCRSRRVLSYSYPFAFCIFSDDLLTNEMTKEGRVIKQNLFEDQQQQFEANVEKLSSLMEEQFDEYREDDFMEFRMKIITLSTVTDNLCRNLYEFIENDLLSSLQSHRIAPYNSKGVEKASELPICWDISASNTGTEIRSAWYRYKTSS